MEFNAISWGLMGFTVRLDAHSCELIRQNYHEFFFHDESLIDSPVEREVDFTCCIRVPIFQCEDSEFARGQTQVLHGTNIHSYLHSSRDRNSQHQPT